MQDYPKTLMEMEKRFTTQEECVEYLAKIRWPGGFTCPDCQGKTAWRVRKFSWECANCHRQTNVTAGTLFENSHMPLPVWFRAIWWVVAQKNGASALGLQRALGLSHYKTA